MIVQLNLKKINLVKKFENEIINFLNLVKDTYHLSNNIKTIESAITYLNNINATNSNEPILIFEQGELIIIILDIIHTQFKIIIETKTYNEFKIFITTYNKLLKNIKEIDIDLQNLIINFYEDKYFSNQLSLDEEKEEKEEKELEIIANFKKFSDIFKQNTYSFIIYKSITTKLLEDYKKNPYIYTNILNINEKMKNLVISIPNQNLLKNSVPLPNYSDFIKNNSYINSFGLVPVSNLMNIKDITLVLFPNSDKDLQTNCIEKKYDLIIIKKYLNRGINYSILDLLDYTKSKNYELSHSLDDGITVETVNRFNNIQYIANTDKAIDFEIDYKYVIKSDINKYTIIIEEIYPNQFHLLSNIYNSYITHFIRKTSILEFIEFLSNKSGPRSRIENYNTITNRGIMINMFSGGKHDIKQLEEKSLLAYDPKELRFNIYTSCLEKYKQLNTKPLKTLFAFSKLLHNKEFGQIFSNTISNEYNIILNKNSEIYKRNNISISELYISFVRELYISSRDFKKKLHDSLIISIIEILDNISTTIDMNKEFGLIFDKLLSDTLNIVISTDKNIFQSLNYKLTLLKKL